MNKLLNVLIGQPLKLLVLISGALYGVGVILFRTIVTTAICVVVWPIALVVILLEIIFWSKK